MNFTKTPIPFSLLELSKSPSPHGFRIFSRLAVFRRSMQKRPNVTYCLKESFKVYLYILKVYIE